MIFNKILRLFNRRKISSETPITDNGEYEVYVQGPMGWQVKHTVISSSTCRSIEQENNRIRRLISAITFDDVKGYIELIERRDLEKKDYIGALILNDILEKELTDKTRALYKATTIRS